MSQPVQNALAELEVSGNVEAFHMTRIKGEPQSGKTEKLLTLALEASQQDAQVVILAHSKAHQRGLEKSLKSLVAKNQLLSHALPSVQTWQSFIEQQSQQAFKNVGVQSVNHSGARTVLSRVIESVYHDETHPHFYAVRQAGFQHTLFSWLISEAIINLEKLNLENLNFENLNLETLKFEKLNANFQELKQVITTWQGRLHQEHRYTHAELMMFLIEAIQNQRESQPSFLTHPVEKPQIICVDDADDLSVAQWQLLSAWHLANSDNRQVIVTGLSVSDSEESKVPLVLAEKALRKNQLTLEIYPDAIQEAQALAAWIAQQQQQEKAQWADFLILVHQPAMETILIDVLISQQIPVQASKIPLDLKESHMAIYDSLQALSALEQLSSGYQSDVNQLFVVNAKVNSISFSQALALQELWQQLFQALERLVYFVAPEEASFLEASFLASFGLASSGSYETFVKQIYLGQEPGYQSANQLLHAMLNLVSKKQSLQTQILSHQKSQQLSLLTSENTNQSEPEKAESAQNIQVNFRDWVYTHVLKQAIQQQPALIDFLEAAFFIPLGQMMVQLTDVTFQEVERQFFSLWQVLDQTRLQAKNIKTDAVRIESYTNIHGQHARFVCMPFLTQDGLPQNPSEHPLHLLLSNQDLLGASHDKSASWLRLGISRYQEKLWLSAHQKKNQEIAWPHPLLIQLEALKLQADIVRETQPMDAGKNHAAITEFEATGAWGQLFVEPVNQKVLDTEKQPIIVSPTGINTYLKCPRQYFYKQILRLPETRPDTQKAAQLGLLVHRLMEVFNQNVARKTLAHNYTSLEQLLAVLFDYKTKAEIALSYGFKEMDFESIQNLNAFAQGDLQQKIAESIEDLAAKGYFERLADLKNIEPEKKVLQKNIPGLYPCTLQGKVDAIAEMQDGTFWILDYKFYNTNRFANSLDSIQKAWQQTLSPLSYDPMTAKAIYYNTDSQPTDYQLPLYYLALQQEAKYQGKIQGTVLQLIRPAFGDNFEKGSTPLFLRASEMDEALEKHLLNDMNKAVLEPLSSSHHFEPSPGPSCDYCVYQGICEAAEICPGAEGSALS